MMKKALLKERVTRFQRLTFLSVVILALLIIVAQKHETAFAAPSPSSYKVTVTAWALNVRESGDISSRIIDVVHQGDILTVIQTKNGWDEIKRSNNQTGWVSNAYVKQVNEKTTENLTATVEAPVLNVRENPSLSSQVVGQLKLGTQITVLNEQAGWAKIVSSSGVKGWLYEYYITKHTPSDQQTQVDTNTSDNLEPLQNKDEPLKGKTIVLDPGHGGKDNGTTSRFSSTHEKTLTLATAIVVEQKLENAGADVIMTRTTDTFIPLEQRAEISNQNHADAFISIHYNWSNDPTINGVTDFYYQQSKDNPLASAILNEISKTSGLQNRGARFDNLNVLRNNAEPSTLIELGFLSNQQDDSIVESSDYREEVAQGVYQGLIDYFSKIE